MLKEPNYVSMLMGSFGSMVESTEESAQVVRMMNFSKNSDDTSKVKFNLTEPFHWYYKYRGCVDNNNAKRHYPCSFEEAWKTTKWPHCVFAFVISVAEINAYQVAQHFLDFQRMKLQ